MPPLAAAALLSVPLAASTLAGRARTILDGLVVAASLLLVSWLLVLAPIVRAGADSMLTEAIALAYPVGDTVVITIVVYTWLRARQSAFAVPVSLPLVGVGLVAFAVADSGFVYLTTTKAYSSGSLIDAGWFIGFTVMLAAAARVETRVQDRGTSDDARADVNVAETADGLSRQLDTFLPYAAVSLALFTGAVVFIRGGEGDPFIVWDGMALTAFLVSPTDPHPAGELGVDASPRATRGGPDR